MAELCESELGTDYERKLKSFFQSKPEQLKVVGNTRKDRFVGLTCVSTQRAYDSYSIHTRIKKCLNVYVLFDKEAF